MGFPGSASGKEATCQGRRDKDAGLIPGEGHGNHPSILDWRIPWIAEPGGLWFIESQRVGHD